MYNGEVIRLQNQINKAKEIYINRKKERELLVDTMNILDQKLEELEKNKGIKKTNSKSKQEKQRINKKNKKIKKHLKKYG